MIRQAKASFAGSNLGATIRPSRSACPCLLGLALVLTASLLAPTSALAAASHHFLETFGSANEPAFTEPEGMAVDQATGDLLVIDAGTATVSRYHQDGTPSNFSALGTNLIDGQGTGDETPQAGLFFASPAEVQVAVDNSGGATDGNIYVTQSGSHLIDIFGEDGSFLGQLTEYNEGPAAEGSATELGETCGVAVDPSGSVYVGDFFGQVHKYEPAASPPTNADNSANFAFSEVCTLAAGAGPTAGFIFATHYNGAVAKLDAATGAEEYEVDAGPTTTVSLDPSSGHLYTARGGEIVEFDASGASSATELPPSISLGSGAAGVAVYAATGNVYATRVGGPDVEVFAPGPSSAPSFELSIQKTGNGSGVVTSLAPNTGINCGSECSAEFEEGREVKLEATAAPNSEFTGWTTVAGDPGTCTGTTSPCEVTMEEAVELEAGFELLPPPAVTALGPTEGSTSGGNEVEITGSDLSNATKVEFGSTVVNAPFAENTAAAIKVNAPAHPAGTFDVIVTTGGGPSANTAADDYTYVAPPAVTALSPAHGPTAGGNQVEITGLRLAEASKVEFGSTVVNAPFTENTSTAIKVNAPAHAAGKVNVRVTTVGGLSGNFANDDYTYEAPGLPVLSVSKTGTGSGVVTSSPAGINCGSECEHAYAEGTLVTLTASTGADFAFAGWSGGSCSGTGACVVAMSAARAVTATFTANPPPPPAGCVVPKLKGLSLSDAKSALTSAHCKTGKVTKPKPKKGKKLGPLVVKSSKPGAGTTLPADSKADLKLGLKPKKKA